MTCLHPTVDLTQAFVAEQARHRRAETLGAMPREALAALVDYGLSDADIARYHALPEDLVTRLRLGWGIAGNP